MKITETQLKRIIGESVKKVIAEEMSMANDGASQVANANVGVQQNTNAQIKQLAQQAWTGMREWYGAINQLYNQNVIPINMGDKRLNKPYLEIQNALAQLATLLSK